MITVGRWQDVMPSATASTLIADPPYGEQTHEMSKMKDDQRFDGSTADGLSPTYDHWTADDVHEFVSSWSPRISGWMACLTSSDLIEPWQAAYRAVDRYSFAPVACVMRGMTVRLGGDGPASWTAYLMVARPRSKEFATWGALPGAYVVPRSMEAGGGRGKPDWLMRAIVRDYSRPGDLVVDPVCGWGSTLAAAIGMGRRAIGCDVDADAVTEAKRRLARGTQMDLLG